MDNLILQSEKTQESAELAEGEWIACYCHCEELTLFLSGGGQDKEQDEERLN